MYVLSRMVAFRHTRTRRQHGIDMAHPYSKRAKRGWFGDMWKGILTVGSAEAGADVMNVTDPSAVDLGTEIYGGGLNKGPMLPPPVDPGTGKPLDLSESADYTGPFLPPIIDDTTHSRTRPDTPFLQTGDKLPPPIDPVTGNPLNLSGSADYTGPVLPPYNAAAEKARIKAEAEARRKAQEREETQRLLAEKLKKQHEKHQQDILSGKTHHRSRGDSYNEGTSDSTTKPTIHTIEETIKHVQNITNEKNVTNVTHTNEIDKVEQHTTVETTKTFAQDHMNMLIGLGAVAVAAAIYLTHE